MGEAPRIVVRDCARPSVPMRLITRRKPCSKNEQPGRWCGAAGGAALIHMDIHKRHTVFVDRRMTEPSNNHGEKTPVAVPARRMIMLLQASHRAQRRSCLV